MQPATDRVKSTLPGPVRSTLGEFKWKLIFAWTDLRDSFAEAHSLPHPVPGSRLRFKVHGELGREDYLLVGDNIAADLAKLATEYDLDPEPNQRVLDFGCGCGRVTTWLHQLWPGPNWYGCDVDQEAIAWCREHLDFGKFYNNDPRPPLDYGDSGFELAVAVSVFTHLDEAMQSAWFEELHRVLAPGSHLIVTVNGPHSAELLDSEQRAELENTGLFFLETGDWEKFHPGWYQTAYHTERFFTERLNDRFEVLDHRERYINDDQDCVLLRKV